MDRDLTHKEVETSLVYFMKNRGWVEIKDGRYKFKKLRPDRIFRKQGNKYIIVAEVKPENIGAFEIDKGIGQSARYLVYPTVAPYLVLPEAKFNEVKDVFLKLSWLGIICYSKLKFQEGNGYSMTKETQTFLLGYSKGKFQVMQGGFCPLEGIGKDA